MQVCVQVRMLQLNTIDVAAEQQKTSLSLVFVRLVMSAA